MFYSIKKGVYILKKKLLFVILVFFVVIIFAIFIKINYKKIKIGNNESNKSVKEIEEYILNINSYTATLDITVRANKNENKYIIKQEYNKNNLEKQTVVKPENIEGTEIIYKDGNLELKNSNLNLSKMYSNYPYLSDNALWLNAFIEGYKNNRENSSIYEENDFIVMQISNKNNNRSIQKLYLEKGTGLPKKMIIQDNNQKDTIYILYTEININN